MSGAGQTRETERGGFLRPAIGLVALAAVTGLALLGLLRPDPHGHAPHEAAFHGAPDDGPSPEAARADPARLLSYVLGRVYRAFGEQEEGAIYDALAGVAAGPVLEELYLERRAVLTAASAEGAEQVIHGIEVLQAAAEERDGAFVLDGRWETVGSVGHGDHVHVRGNRYAATLTVERGAEGWRLTAFDLVDMVRAQTAEGDAE